ncbi:hypothetical protein H4R33_006257, partial [Dimargaris cristalligena]
MSEREPVTGIQSFFRRLWRRTRYRRVFYAFCIFCIWLVVVPSVYTLFLYQGGKMQTASGVEMNMPTGTTDFVEFWMVAQQADFAKHKVTFYVTAEPHGKYHRGHSELNSTVTAYFGAKEVVFDKDKKMQAIDLPIPILGYPRLFPFDSYSGSFEISLSEVNVDQGNATVAVPFRLSVYSNVQSITVITGLSIVPNYEDIVLADLLIKRTSVTVGFSIVIMTVMWGLALTLTTLAFQILIIRRDFNGPLLTAGITMMFSLPALRNSQPGVPAFGCASDMLSFFWCLFMIAVSAISILLSVVLRWKSRPKKEDGSANQLP